MNKKELFTKMAIVAKVVVSDCWFLFGCVLWSSFKTLMSYRLTSELFVLRY